MELKVYSPGEKNAMREVVRMKSSEKTEDVFVQELLEMLSNNC
jgi:hypothetical protein